jgi:hypothetical protein
MPGKLARPVLRGEGRREAPLLPDLCDCCTCNNCKSRKTAIETWMDLVEEETGGAGPQALTRGRLSDLFVIAEALEALGHRGSAG